LDSVAKFQLARILDDTLILFKIHHPQAFWAMEPTLIRAYEPEFVFHSFDENTGGSSTRRVIRSTTGRCGTLKLGASC